MSLNLFSTLVGESRVMHKLYAKISDFALHDEPVLILGEAATGKDSAAYELHCESTRSYESFVTLNCATVPAELLESEIFGHQKGAFQGAITAHKGRLALAEKGCLFLDEIDCLPQAIQLKLITAIRQGIYYPIGSQQPEKCDVRWILGARNDLKESVDTGHFLAELYALFRTHVLDMPALRDRSEDIESLIQVLLAKLQPSEEACPYFSQEALDALQNYDWPGNLRELECLLESLIDLYPGQVIALNDLPVYYHEHHSKEQMPLGLIQNDMAFLLSGLDDSSNCPQLAVKPEWLYHQEVAPQNALILVPPFDLHAGQSMKFYLQQVEIQLILGALQQTEGNVSQAAKLLQVNRTTLVEKIRKFDLKDNELA